MRHERSSCLFLPLLAASCCLHFSDVIGHEAIAPLEKVGGSWLGASQGNSEYFRLEINDGGKGILAVQYLPGESADAYKVLSTSLSGYKIDFILEPIGEAEPIFLRGFGNKAGLSLDVGNVANKWHRKVFLESEGDVLSRIEAVTKRVRGLQPSPGASAKER